MDQIIDTYRSGAKFQATTLFETVVIFPIEKVSVIDIFNASIKYYIEKNAIPIEAWDAGKREDDTIEHPGYPDKKIIEQLNRETTTFASLKGENKSYDPNKDNKFCFSSIQILAHSGDQEDFDYQSSNSVSLTLSSGDLSGDQTPERTRNVIDSHVYLVRQLVKAFPVLNGHIYRNTESYAPITPHASDENILYIVNSKDVEASYNTPDLYWQSWDEVEPLENDRFLVTKALDIEDELAYKLYVYPKIWQLARDAKPHFTQYASPSFSDYDIPYIDGPEATTRQVGYHADEQWIEYTAYPPENGHILPREIYAFRKWLVAGQLDSGEPIKEVRISFQNLKTAEQEKRPLLDIGCRIFYYDNLGELVELKD